MHIDALQQYELSLISRKAQPSYADTHGYRNIRKI